VAGGKFTTHREIGQKLVDLVMKELGKPRGRCPTLRTPLPGARPLDCDATSGDDKTIMHQLPRESREILQARYGTRAAIPARIAAERSELARPIAPGCPAIGAEVVNDVRNEMVHSIEDFLIRRTSLSWRSPVEAQAAAPAVARLLARELGWDRAREEAEITSFTRSQRNPVAST
jgi:glycerol-3-phosphate dehydrogenase